MSEACDTCGKSSNADSAVKWARGGYHTSGSCINDCSKGSKYGCKDANTGD